MQALELKNYFQAQPYRPIRLRLRNGDVHVVSHPRLALVTSFDVIVGTPDPKYPPPCAADTTLIALESIAQVEYVDSPTTERQN